MDQLGTASTNVDGERRTAHGARLIRRRQANDGMMPRKRGTGRRDGSEPEAEPDTEPVTGSVVGSVAERQSPKSDRFSQESSSSSAVTLDYSEDDQRLPAERSVPDGMPSYSPELTTCVQRPPPPERSVPDGIPSCSPEPTTCVARRHHSAPSLLDDHKNRDPLDGNEARRTTASSGAPFNGAQTAAAADPDLPVDQTSVNAVGETREEVESKTGSVFETADGPRTSGVVADEAGSSRGDLACTPAGVKCAVQRPMDMVHGGSADVERSRRSAVMMSRRRHCIKSTRRRSASDNASKMSSPPAVELTRCAAVSPTLHNGINPDD